MFDISDTAHRKKKYLIVPSGPYMEGKLKHLVKCTALSSRPGPAPTRSRADRLLRGRILQSTLEGTERRDHPSNSGISQQLITSAFAPYLNLVPSTDDLQNLE